MNKERTGFDYNKLFVNKVMEILLALYFLFKRSESS